MSWNLIVLIFIDRERHASVYSVPAIDYGLGTDPVPVQSIKREDGSAPMHQRVWEG